MPNPKVHAVDYTQYEFPMLCERGAKLESVGGVIRYVNREQYAERSQYTQQPSDFDRFLLRAISRTEGARENVVDAMRAVAMQRIQKYNDEFEDALEYVNYGAGTVDALFGDVYRALMRRAVVRKDGSGLLPPGQILDALQQTPEWGGMLREVNGDPSLALARTAEIFRALFANDTVAESMADANPQEQQNAGNDTADTDSEQEQEDENGQDENGGEEQGSGGGDNGSGDDEEEQSDDGNEQDGDGDGDGGSSDRGSGKNETDEQEQDGDGDAGQDAGSGNESTQRSGNNPGRPSREEVQEAVANAMAQYAYEQRGEDENDPVDHTAGWELAGGLLAGSSVGTHGDDISAVPLILNMASELLTGYGAAGINTTRLQSVYNVLGRADTVLGNALVTSKHGDGEVADVVVGGNPMQALPSEYANLGVDELEMQFYYRLAEQQLTQLERRGVDDAGAGPLIVMVDISGSTMHGITFMGTNTTILAVEFAFAAALAKYARKWNRPIAIVPFDAEIQPETAFVMGGMERKSQSAVHAELERCLATSASGGTCFVGSLAGVPELLQRFPVFESADVIFLTDGEGGVDERSTTDIKRTRAAMEGVRVFGFIIQQRDDEYLSRLEHTNSALFDTVIACRPGDVETGLERLFRSIVETSFYGAEKTL